MGTKERRQREARRRRESILAAARHVFWAKGYEQTTVPAIAEQAELAPGTLYLYFPSKSAMYAELLVEGYKLLERHLRAVAAVEAGPREKGRALIDAFYDFARDQPEYFDILFFVLRRDVPGGRDAVFAPDQQEHLSACEDACKAVVAEALSESAFVPPAGQAGPAVEAIWSMLAGVVCFFNRQDCFDDVVAEATGLMLRAVYGQADEGPAPARAADE